MLDAIGPYDVLRQVPGADVTFVAADPGHVGDERGSGVMQVPNPLGAAPSPDVIVVPGGFGSRALCTGANPLVDWIAAVHPTTTFTTSVCTGSLILGAADALASFGATPVSRRVVRQGKVFTAAGVSAGIDMALQLAAELAGEDVAKAIQLGIEYDPEPPFDSGSPAKADAALVELVRGITAPVGAA
jgi:putative intracellular protease/amidase